MPPNEGQKTEKPTQRRRRRARQEGQVAQSAEVNNALVLLAGAGAVALFGGRTFQCLVGCISFGYTAKVRRHSFGGKINIATIYHYHIRAYKLQGFFYLFLLDLRAFLP